MSGPRSICLVGALFLAMALAGTEAGAAAPDKQDEISARQSFAAGRYDEAIELFAKLYAQTLNPIYLRNIGRCHQKKREPEKAIDAFQDYLAKERGILPPERKEIRGYIHEMEQLRDENARRSQAAANPPPPATPRPAPAESAPVAAIAGNPAQPPPTPAPPTLALGAAPPAPDNAGQMIVAQEAHPSGESHPFYARWWFWTAVGVVAAGAVVAVLLASSGGVNKPDCRSPAVCQ